MSAMLPLAAALAFLLSLAWARWRKGKAATRAIETVLNDGLSISSEGWYLYLQRGKYIVFNARSEIAIFEEREFDELAPALEFFNQRRGE